MSAVSASRALLRQSRLQLRGSAPFRNQSTTSEAANAAKEKTSQAQSKASEGLSKVQSQASGIISKAGSFASSTASSLSKVGGRTGRLINFTLSLVPPTVYYSKVGLEMGKIIFRQRSMSPPSMQTFQEFFQPLLNNLRTPSKLLSSTQAAGNAARPTNILSSVRNADRQQIMSAGIVAAEVLGFFTVGEMLGRFKIVGYRGGHAEHH